MKYDFDQVITRRGTGCVKWDESGQEDVIPLWVADMDFAVAPAIQEAIRQRAQHPVFGYTHVQDDYYEAVASWFQRRHGWTIQREWILYTTGVVPAMSVAVKAFTMPGERVLILSPDYNCFFSSIRNNGCEVAESVLVWSEEEKRFLVDWDSFETICADEKTTMFLLCNPHNPTGRIWTREELQRMSAICRQHKVTLVSDEIHCELTMPGHVFTPMGTVDDDAVVLNSPSKSFNIAGLMMANIICKDPAKRRRLDRAININEVCDVNVFGPVAVKAAYNDSEQWLDELNAYLYDNYRVLCDFVAQELPALRVMPLEGTYLVWVDCRQLGVPVDELCERLLREGRVWVNPGTMYGPTSGQGYIRINIACPRAQLMEGLRRMASVIKLTTTDSTD